MYLNVCVLEVGTLERKVEIVKIVHLYHGLSSSISLKPDVSIGIIFNSYLM